MRVTGRYLRLSITVLGPRDKQPVHDLAQEREKESKLLKSGKTMADMVMMPPEIKTELHFLVATIYKAEHLPNMDAPIFGGSIFGIRGGIDAFVQIDFAGNPKCTTSTKNVKIGKGRYGAKTFMNPVFNEQLWLPVHLASGQTMSNRISIAVWDHDAVGSDERVATAKASFREITLQRTLVRPPKEPAGSRNLPREHVHMAGPKWWVL